MTSSASRERTYYDVLGVPQGATAEDVKAAYRKAVLCLHPDKTQSACSDLTADRNAFQKLHAAWQVLKDAGLRAAYDGQLRVSGHGKEVFVSGEVDLDDMEEHMSANGLARFSHACRCGEAFVCAEEELTETADSLLVQCQGCSLIIRVLYTVAGEPQG